MKGDFPRRGADDPMVADPDEPGVPGMRTWRSVYLFVLGCFVAAVVALTIFTRLYR